LFTYNQSTDVSAASI